MYHNTVLILFKTSNSGPTLIKHETVDCVFTYCSDQFIYETSHRTGLQSRENAKPSALYTVEVTDEAKNHIGVP